MNKKDLEMREQAREAIIEALRDGYSGYYHELHHEVFNTSYYTIWTHEAKKELEEFGLWDAIKKVQTYERETFGGVYTDLSDPIKLINMLYYIIGEEVLNELMEGVEVWNENWNNVATDETNALILKEVEL